MNVLELVRDDLRNMKPYQAAAQVEDTVRLNANESPRAGTSMTFRRSLNRYPELRPKALAGLLASHFDCPIENLLPTRGSSEAIDLLIRTFCRTAVDSVVIPSPSFSMYRHYARLQGVDVIEVISAKESNFVVDIEALGGAIRDDTKLLILCSPNNPTGAMIKKNALTALLERVDGRAVVVIDEAYIEFSESASNSNLIDQYPNLVVLRTLSKAVGLAGARCGAVIADNDLVELLAAVQAPYALATPVVEAVEDALRNYPTQNPIVSDVLLQRERLRGLLETLVCVEKVWPSAANFLLVQFTDASKVLAWVQNANILIRDYSAELPNCIRISIGSETEIDVLLEALNAYEESAA